MPSSKKIGKQMDAGMKLWSKQTDHPEIRQNDYIGKILSSPFNPVPGIGTGYSLFSHGRNIYENKGKPLNSVFHYLGF